MFPVNFRLIKRMNPSRSDLATWRKEAQDLTCGRCGMVQPLVLIVLQ